MAAIASRYARALVEVVLEQKIEPNSAIQQVNSIVQAVRESGDLRKIWESPGVPAAQKRRLLDAIASQMSVSRPVRNFYAVLIDHQRIPMVQQIARQFEVELNAQLGFAEAQVTSARELSSEQKRELEARVSTMTGKKVRAHYASDPALLGGVMVQLGSTIYDGSVRGQLQKLRQELVNS
jgi:F-type H+-transporting ATPase subunit delta